MNVVGIDVGRNGFVAVALDSFVPNPLQWFNDHRQEFTWLGINQAGLEALSSMQPDALVMEPTGSWYSSFLKEWAASRNIPVYWVGHADLKSQRESYGFKNKRDDEDAFSLALTYFDLRFIDRQGRKRFLEFNVGSVMRLRELFLETEQVDKDTNALVNQIRQRLCRELPEVAERKSEVSLKLGYAPMWGHLAGIRQYTNMRSVEKTSVARQVGIQISPYTRAHASAICELQIRESALEAEMIALLNEPEFQPYLKVFKRFGFGLRNRVLVLTQVYPFSKFLVDGRPWIDWETPPPKRLRGKKEEAKPQKRHRSQRSFQAYLGLSFKLKQSGDSIEKAFLGSDLVRNHLYMWVVDKMRKVPREVNLNDFIIGKNKALQHIHANSSSIEFEALPVFKVDTCIGHQLNRKVIQMEYDGVKGSDKVVRIMFRATALLFRELCKELVE